MDQLRGLVRRQPDRFALAALGPSLLLPPNPERKHIHLAGDLAPALALAVLVPADRSRTDISCQPGLLVGFIGDGTLRLSRNRPSLRDGPPPLAAGCDQQHVELGVPHPEWKRCQLSVGHICPLAEANHRTDVCSLACIAAIASSTLKKAPTAF